MARSRNLKPSFFTNEDLAECPPLARLLFAGLWCHADREGRLECRPKRLKAAILPYDDCDVAELLQTLESRGFVRLYTAGNVDCIQILNFVKHQNPHPREPKSELPAEESRGNALQDAESHEKPRQEMSRQEPARPLPSSPIPHPNSEANASSADARIPADPKAWVFGELLSWLKQATGRSEASLRSWLGKGCRDFGDNAVVAAGMMVRAPPVPVDPLAAMAERLKQKAGNGRANGSKFSVDSADIREPLAAAALARSVANEPSGSGEPGDRERKSSSGTEHA